MNTLIESLHKEHKTYLKNLPEDGYICDGSAKELILSDSEFLWVIIWDADDGQCGCECFLHRNGEKSKILDYSYGALLHIWHNENVIIFIFERECFVYDRFCNNTCMIYTDDGTNPYTYFTRVKFNISADGYYIYYTKLAYNTMTNQTTNPIQEYADTRILLFNLLG